uniref:Uncharacterized protein n=1 Tax=Anopheles stephensi TaxID=30069 RepID=A0A182YCP5_ANOST
MLSYMLPVEEKSPSAAAAAATRNLSLNLTTTTATTTAVGGGSVGGGVVVSTGGSAGGATATIARDCNTGASTISASTSASTGQVRSIIKPTVKHGTANHRYQLIGSGGTDAKLLGPGEGRQTRHGSGHWQDEQEVEPDLCDESTNLLAGTGCGEDDDDVDEREVGIDDRPRRPGPVKSDKNFNNLIVVTNGRHTTKPTNGNHAASTPKLASALKPTNNCVSGPVGRPGSSSSNSGGGGGAAGNHTSSSGGAYYNGYIAVSGDNDDEHHRMLVSANNLRNTSVVEQRQEWNATGRNGEGLVTSAATTTDPPRPASSSFSSNSRITTTTNGNCGTMNSLNGNLMGTEPPPAVAPLPLETAEMGSGAADVSLGSDSDSATGAGGSATTGGGKKVKLNKLGGNKNVTLKRTSRLQHQMQVQ